MNAIVVFFSSTILLLLLNVVHFLTWRFSRQISRLNKKWFKKMPVLTMPIDGTNDAEPGRVYAKIKLEFAAGNEQGCELPLIYMISKNLTKEFPDIRELLARCYLAKDQITKAELILNQAFLEEFSNAPIYVLMFEVLKKQKRFMEALEILKKGIKNLGDSEMLLEPLYLMAKKLKDKKEIKNALRKLLKLNPENEALKYQLKKYK